MPEPHNRMVSVQQVHNLQKLKKYHLKQLTFLQQKQK